MTKEFYWKLIDTFREKSRNDLNRFYEIGKETISNLERHERIEFNMYTARYMKHMTDCIWLDMACKVINDYVSDDTALYFYLWIISQGKDVLLNALKDPDSLASLKDIPFGEAEFEMFMNIGFLEEDFEYMPYDEELIEIMKLNGESEFTNEGKIELSEEQLKEVDEEILFKNNLKYGDYESFEEGMNDLENILPKLLQRRNSYFK